MLRGRSWRGTLITLDRTKTGWLREGALALGRLCSRDWSRPHWRILCYHAVPEEEAGGFMKQLLWLREIGFEFCSLGEGLEAVSAGTLRRPLATVTFDDGDRTAYDVAMPILSSLGIPACAYVVPDYVEQGITYRDEAPRPAMTWAQVREWLGAGNETGSHTLTHAMLPLSGAERLAQELYRSKALLEDRLGVPVPHLAYPWGQVDGRVVRYLKESRRYRSAATIHRGPMESGHDPLLLSRDLVYAHQSLDDIELRMRLADRFYWLRHLRPKARGYGQTHSEVSWRAIEGVALDEEERESQRL